MDVGAGRAGIFGAPIIINKCRFICGASAKNEPQMKKLVKVLSNEGYASHTPTLRKPKSRFMNAPSRASGGRIHVNRCASWRRPHVWLRHTWRYVSMHSGGHDADERKFNASAPLGRDCAELVSLLQAVLDKAFKGEM